IKKKALILPKLNKNNNNQTNARMLLYALMLRAIKNKPQLLLSLTRGAFLIKFLTAPKSNKNNNNQTNVKTLQHVLTLQVLRHKQLLLLSLIPPAFLTRIPI